MRFESWYSDFEMFRRLHTPGASKVGQNFKKADCVRQPISEFRHQNVLCLRLRLLSYVAVDSTCALKVSPCRHALEVLRGANIEC